MATTTATETGGEDGADRPTATALLLLVVGEPFTGELKEAILQRITKELSSWDNDASGIDLNEELQAVAAKAPIGEDGQNGEKIVQHNSEKLHAEFLISPTLKTLTSKLRAFLVADGKFKQLIHSGPVLQHSGCWVLQDGVFTLGSLADIFRGSDVVHALKQSQERGVLQLSVFSEGDWNESYFSRLAPQLQVRVNPQARVAFDSAGFIQFGAYLSYFLKVVTLKDLLQSSSVVGNIRFSRPTLYVFPSCQGDSALFGISGFNLLVNGGYARKACFWDFTRHLDRIDAMLLTHLGVDNLFGIQSVVARKAQENVHPEIGFIYMNAIERGKSTPDCESGSEGEGRGKKRSLVINLGEEASTIVEDMKAIAPHLPRPCTGVMQGANLTPINLYHKVGHGTLDMYILNPMQDSKALKEFLTGWSKKGNGFTAKGGAVPHSQAASVCALLLWRPASSADPVTRILFPGSTSQATLFEGLERLKSMAVFQHSAGVEKDPRAGGAKKGAAGKPHASKPASGKAPAQPKQEPKQEAKKTAPPAKKEPQKGAAAGKDDKTPDAEKKSTPSSESKSPVDSKQPATSPGAASAVSEVALSEGAITPDGEGVKENEHRSVDTDSLVDIESTSHPSSATVGDAAAIEAEKPDLEEKDIDTKEDHAADEGTEPQSAGGFNDISPEGLPSPVYVNLEARRNQPDPTRCDPEAEADGNIESFDPKKHWGVPMDLPAPNKPPAKSDEAVGADKQAMEIPRKKTSPTKPQAARQVGHGKETGKSEEPKEEDKGKASGDAARKSSASNIKKARPNTAPSETNAKVDPKPARAPAKKPAAASAGAPPKPQSLKPVVPFYVDLAYIPGHGSSSCVDVDFFRKVRARYYVLSTVSPDAGVLTALLEAKQTWDDPDLETTIIPTYDADVLRYWMAAHRDHLNQHRIDVAPSANRCSIQLQDHETSCAAYRLEF